MGGERMLIRVGRDDGLQGRLERGKDRQKGGER